MKHAVPVLIGLSVSAGLLVAGPLTPPAGPVGSTYKTLNEVEPRIPIDHVPFVINASGSYYATKNLTMAIPGDGVQVQAYNVTIDLNGFTLDGAGLGSTGINCAYLNLAVKNGFIKGFGYYGIYANNGAATIDHVSAASCAWDGIYVGINSQVTACTSRANGRWGIATSSASRVAECFAIGNNLSNAVDVGGIYAGNTSRVIGCSTYYNHGCGMWLPNDSSASGCLAQANTGPGFRLSDRSVVEESLAASNGAEGVLAEGSGATVRRCIARDNAGNGILIGPLGTVAQNVAQGNTAGAGVYLAGGGSRIEANDLGNNGYAVRGLSGVSTNNLLTGNVSHGGASYSVTASDDPAPIITNPTNNLWGGISAWSNFAY